MISVGGRRNQGILMDMSEKKLKRKLLQTYHWMMMMKKMRRMMEICLNMTSGEMMMRALKMLRRIMKNPKSRKIRRHDLLPALIPGVDPEIQREDPRDLGHLALQAVLDHQDQGAEVLTSLRAKKDIKSKEGRSASRSRSLGRKS